MKRYEIGEKLTTKVVAVAGDTVFIELNEKCEGLVDAASLTDAKGNITIKAGDSITVFYVGHKADGEHFSAKLGGEAIDKIDSATKEALIESAFREGAPIEGTVVNEIKGGFDVTIGGVRAFCPYSQMGGRDKDERISYIGRKMSFIITQYEKATRGSNIVVSNRAFIERGELESLEKASTKVKVGDIVTGKVKRLGSFGAIIEIEGLEALLPISMISSQKVENIESVLAVGQDVSAKVIEFTNRSTDKKAIYNIKLSMKALERDPWLDIGQFHIGDKITGTIENVAKYGLFVTLAKGLTGFVHISKIEGLSESSYLPKLFKVGAKYPVIIEKIDEERRRIELAPSTSKEEDEAASAYMSSQDDSETYNPFAALLKAK